MRCAKERYLAIILIIAMILTCMPVTAFGLDIPAGYKENTESGSKISTNVYLTISASEDADDGSNTGGGDTSEKILVQKMIAIWIRINLMIGL